MNSYIIAEVSLLIGMILFYRSSIKHTNQEVKWIYDKINRINDDFMKYKSKSIKKFLDLSYEDLVLDLYVCGKHLREPVTKDNINYQTGMLNMMVTLPEDIYKQLSSDGANVTANIVNTVTGGICIECNAFVEHDSFFIKPEGLMINLLLYDIDIFA